MHLKASWKKLLAVIGLFAIGMVLLSILELFGGKPNSVQAPVPKDCIWVARFDANSFWQKELYAVLFEAEDESVMNDFKKLLNEKYITKESKPIALDIRKDIVAYQTQIDQHLITCLILQLTDPTTFKENMSAMLGNSGVVHLEGNTAMLVFSGREKLTKSKLKSIANKLSKAPLMNIQDIGEKDDLIAIKSGLGNKQAFNYGLKCHSEKIELNGTVDLTVVDFTPLTHTVKSTGFSIYSARVPSELSNRLINQFPFLGRSNPHVNPHITGFSIDYQGVLIADATDGMPNIYGVSPLPKFNAIIRCDDVIHLDSITKYFKVPVENGILKMGNVDYHLKLIDKYTLFIGIDPNSIEKSNRTEYLSISGDLTSLTTFEGSMFTTAFISNVKEVKALKQLFEASGDFELTVTKKKGKTFDVNATLPFEAGKNSFNELTRLLLTLNLMK